MIGVMRYGVCCIVLALKERGLGLQTMTYSSFSRMERDKALEILGSRILNNMVVTLESIRFCRDRGYCYRLSSDLFPLLTYDKAGVCLEDLPQYDPIFRTVGDIRSYISDNPVRVSTHPDQFNVLASENMDAVSKTVRELNFQSWFMDMIGCSADYSCPINIHVNNNSGSRPDVIERLFRNMDRLDENCRRRLVLENDDKVSCWSVRMLMDHYHSRTGGPVTFDYLHHRCHPDGLPEEDAVRMCHSTWSGFTPLFHFSESRDGTNPRAHADYPSSAPNTYGLDFDLDFEFKMKCKAIERYQSCLAS
jgi:UV DNA damage endonuclease